MKVVLAFLAACCLALQGHASPVTITVPEAKVELGPTDYRLEKFILPSNYKIDLSLATDFPTTKKFGISNCDITFNVDETVVVANKKVIRIHYAVDFVQEKIITLTDKDGESIEIETFTAPDPNTEIAVITLKEDLATAKGPYILKFTKLTGTLRGDMSGFYLSSYINEGTTKYIATTQFQSTDARAAFPCFDEPFFKATFDISITAPNAYATVLGNTKPVGPSVPLGSDLATTTFTQTPIMSTYLVAFIVSSFSKSDDTLYAIFYPEGMDATAIYAKEQTPKIINDLGEKLGILYPALGNDQLYQAALPDFSAGAMENWGLATYRETALLWDPKESTARNKQRVCSVVAHEIAHMWFGDSVTMNWWSDTFLNEGFARYFEYHTTANVETSFEMKNQFVLEQQQVIFNADAVSTALPLSSDENAIFTPNQVQSKFNSISYNKGGSVFRMIERVMGAEKFFTALNAYLTKYAKKNTIITELLAEFELEGLRPGMINWFKEGGFPVVTVSISGNDILLSQQRFLLDNNPSTTKWNIPVTYATKTHNADYGNTQAADWMVDSEASTKIVDGFKDTDIFILNVEGSGYYRVNYERGLLERISTQLRTESKGGIPPLNRAILIDDVMNMARVGHQSYDTALDLTKYLVAEKDYYPWVSAFSSFAFLNKRIGDAEVATWFKEYVTQISKNFYESVKFSIADDATHIDILKTALALQWACDLNVEACVAQSKALLASYIAVPAGGENPINPNLRSVAYCNGVRHGSAVEWNFLYTKYLESPSAAEKITIIAALGCSKDTAQLKTYLEKSLISDTPEIRKQDAYSVFSAVVNGNDENLNTAFTFLIDNFEKIPESYASMNALSNIFNTLADRFTTEAQVKQFEDFLTDNEAQLGEAVAVGKSAVATARANLAWTASFQETIRSWLSRERGTAQTATVSALVVVMAAFMVLLY